MTRRVRARRAAAWVRDRRGIAALEFALLAPVLATLVLSLYDVASGLIAWWDLARAADATGLIATNQAAGADGANTLSSAQAATASTAIYAVMPGLRDLPPNRFGVTLTGVVFTATPAGCNAGCAYTAHVAWSAALQGRAATRPCGTLSAAPDSQPPSLATLPADAFSAAPLLVVDVVYDFVPLLSGLFGADATLMKTALMSPRTGTSEQWVRYTGPGAALAQCPGYAG